MSPSNTDRLLAILLGLLLSACVVAAATARGGGPSAGLERFETEDGPIFCDVSTKQCLVGAP